MLKFSKSMEVFLLEKYSHNGLIIEVQEGYYGAKFNDNKLLLETTFTNGANFKKVDIFLDETFVKIVEHRRYSHDTNPEISSMFLVYDYGAWNNRHYKDMSVIKNLERVGEKRLLKNERHNVTLDFGATKAGKEALELLCDELHSLFNIVDPEKTIHFKDWDQTKYVYFKQTATKATFMAGLDVLKELASFLTNKGYTEEALNLEESFFQALLAKTEITLDFKHNFKKKKEKRKK